MTAHSTAEISALTSAPSANTAAAPALHGLRIDDAQHVLAALDRSQAIIEFALDGTVLAVNTNFLRLFGYSEAELVGHHHSLLCAPGVAESADYQALWNSTASVHGGTTCTSRAPTTPFTAPTVTPCGW